MDVFESCAEAVLRLDARGDLADQNAAARDLLSHAIGERIPAIPDARGRTRIEDAHGAEVLVDAKTVALPDGGKLLLLSSPRTRFARGTEEMTEVLLTEQDPTRILATLAAVGGQTLEVDRSLIYRVSLRTQQAFALSEWVTPDFELVPTLGAYPLSFFAGGDAELRRTKSFLESHHDAVHPAMRGDGSAALLHGTLQIKSLLWFPFDFRDDGYYALVFNHVAKKRRWLPAEREFLRVATRQVTLALRQIAWMEERAKTDRAILEAQHLESVRMLAGGVAHDLGGHLGIVLGSIDQARSALGDGGPLGPVLRNAESAALEASRLAKHLLAYSGKGQFVIEPVDLGGTARDLRELLQAAAGDVPVRVSVDAEPLFVSGDAIQLKQVMMNLVRNGAEASRSAKREPRRVENGGVGGGAHDDEASRSAKREARRVENGGVGGGAHDDEAVRTTGDVTVTVRAEGASSVVLQVVDRGIGMTADVKKRILDPFFTTKGEGRGLGLAAVAGIVRAHHGDLHVESTPQVGSIFKLTFPRAAAPRQETPTVFEDRALTGTVLLADDMAALRRTTASLLHALGLDVAEAEDGRAILETLAARPDLDALVMDWTMSPGGEETLARVRKARPDLPIVVMSGYAAEAVRFERDGRTTFLEKPFRLDELESALRRVMCGQH